MPNKRQHIILKWVLMLGLLGMLSGCGEVVIEVKQIPSNTPENAPIYVVGNFNYWDPGDNSYRMTRIDSNTYRAIVPKGLGMLEYKFTRGDWTTVEKDECGYELKNHTGRVFGSDTLRNEIKSWADLKPIDCTLLTLVIDDLPENTPDDAELGIAGDFNRWQWDENYKFIKDSSTGKLKLTIPRPKGIDKLEFKVTRGGLESVECDDFGNELPVRTVFFGEDDSVKLSINNWEDLSKQRQARIHIIIEKIPGELAETEKLYLSSNLNNWYPRDENMRFEKMLNGKYLLSMAYRKTPFEFKITRGAWSSVETDAYGNEIQNRVLFPADADTHIVQIEGWRDNYRYGGKMNLVITKVPKNTPANDALYMATEINGWSPKSKKYKFTPMPNGTYVLELERPYTPVAYKITRGSWESEEVLVNGATRDARRLMYDGDNNHEIEIEAWRDLLAQQITEVTFRVKVPEKTPANAKIYMAANINNWNPADENYKLKPTSDPKIFELVLPKDAKKEKVYFKFTLGSWDYVEVQENGYDIGNREYRLSSEKLAEFEVKGWKNMR